MSSNPRISTGNSAADDDKRRGIDRRRHSFATLTYCGLGKRGRRRTARRAGHNYYLDWYQPKLVMIGITVLLMSCADALFTLSLLNRGAYEANYLMATLLNIDTRLFVAAKVAITASCVTFLLMHANFNIFRITNGRKLLKLMVVVYGMLLTYELVLMRMLA